MRAPLHLVLSTMCLAVCVADNFNNYFSAGFRFDQIEYPAELQHSSFNVQLRGQKQQFEKASEALFAVAVRLKSLLDFRTNGGNFLVSPLSVAATLGQLLLGARGESRRRLSEILSTARKDGAGASIPDVEYHQQFKTLLSLLETSAGENASSYFENYELHIASAFFIQPDLRLRPDFKHAITDLYDCDVVPLNFRGNPVASQVAVNDWVKRNTRGHITSLLSFPLPPSTASLITNAIYFRGAWEKPFDPELTIGGTFKINSRERVAVDYMRGQFELRYAESERLGCQMVVLPYKHKQASMYIFLPFDKNYDIKNFTAAVTVNDMVELKRTSVERSITLIMPKMTLTGKFSLKEPLLRFQKLQERAQAAQTHRRPPTPTTVRRGKRDNSENTDNSQMLPELKNRISNLKRHARGLKPENYSAPKHIQVERSKIEANDSKFETKDHAGNIFTNSKSVAQNKTELSNTNRDGDQTDIDPEDSIKTEIITSSIMVPALPLIVMEVDKTYTVGLNNSHPSLNGNYSNPISHNFPPRQGEFDPNFQINSPLLTSFMPSVYSTQHVNSPRPNNKFQKPVQSQSFVQVGAAVQDHISFPSEENTSEKRFIGRPTMAPQVSYYPASQVEDRPGFINFQQPVNSGSPSASSSASVLPSESVPMSSIYPPMQFNPLSANVDSTQRPASQGVEGDIQFDLTGASEDSRFRIDDILHQMWLEVTETGTEAAAVTGGVVDYSGDVKLVLVDRPFLLVILHEATRATLFWGAIVDPTGGAGLRTEDPLGRPSSVQSSVVHSRGR